MRRFADPRVGQVQPRAVRSYDVWRIWPVQEGVREVRAHWSSYVTSLSNQKGVLTTARPDIAELGKKVVAFYKQKGGEVVSPLVKAI